MDFISQLSHYSPLLLGAAGALGEKFFFFGPSMTKEPVQNILIPIGIGILSAYAISYFNIGSNPIMAMAVGAGLSYAYDFYSVF